MAAKWNRWARRRECINNEVDHRIQRAKEEKLVACYKKRNADFLRLYIVDGCWPSPHGVVIVRLQRRVRQEKKIHFYSSCRRIKRTHTCRQNIIYTSEWREKSRILVIKENALCHLTALVPYRSQSSSKQREKNQLACVGLSRLKIQCKSSSISLWEFLVKDGRKRGE